MGDPMNPACASLQQQLADKELNLRLIEEQLARFVTQTDPGTLPLRKAQITLQSEIERLKADIERICNGTTRRTTKPLPERTLIVDPLYQIPDSYPSITAALETATPGTRILIRPGDYQESLTITTDGLHLIGDGNVAEIVIEASDAPVIDFCAKTGIIKNLTLRQIGEPPEPAPDTTAAPVAIWYPALAIRQGTPRISECIISSQSGACVAIRNQGNPRLIANVITDGETSGVIIYERGRGTLEDNQIFNNAGDGVAISTRARPILRYNRIFRNGQAGVAFVEHGRGRLEENDIYENQRDGIQISTSSKPELRYNRIYGNLDNGILIEDSGQGNIYENDILGNQHAGVLVRSGSTPTLRQNIINRNAAEAIRIVQKGGGTYEHNDLRDNGRGAWKISKDSKPFVGRKQNRRT